MTVRPKQGFGQQNGFCTGKGSQRGDALRDPRGKRLPWEGEHEEGITNKITELQEPC